MRTQLIMQDDTYDVISLEEAMEHARIDDDYDELVVQSTLDGAHSLVESWLNRKIYPTEMIGVEAKFSNNIILPYAPLLSVLSVHAYNSNHELVELFVNVDYKVCTIRSMIKLGINASANCKLYDFEVNYTCGYKDNDCVPSGVKRAILHTFSTMYNDREDSVVGSIVGKVPLTAQRMLMAFRAHTYVR